jgi:formiminotetrahydrofolate cyclodeaminase
VHTDRTVRDFCADLAAGTPAPGGGGAAALAGALGAALAAMVCNYTVGRKRFVSVDAEMRALLSRSDTIRSELLELVEADATAYESVVQAQSQPKDTPEQAAARERDVQAALAAAARVPLRAAVLAADVLALCEPIAERGNPRLASDAGVAALLADAALHSAAINVRVNLGELRDPAVRSECESALAKLASSAREIKPRVMAVVQSKIA